jgi:hypothetical protein
MTTTTTPATAKTNLQHLIDAYGELKAQQAVLADREAQLKEALATLQPGAYEGHDYRLTITQNEREGRDKAFKARIENLIEAHVSAQYIRAHTTYTPVRTHRVVARNGRDVGNGGNGE